MKINLKKYPFHVSGWVDKNTSCNEYSSISGDAALIFYELLLLYVVQTGFTRQRRNTQPCPK